MSNPVPIDIPAALDELGIEYVITGDEAKALCPDPNHDDTTPSWYISLDSGLHQCWSCGYSGSFRRLVADVREDGGGSWSDALLWIQQRKLRDIAEGKQRSTGDRKEHAEITAAELWAFDTDYPADELEFRGVDSNDAQGFKLMWDRERDGWIIPFYAADDERLIGYQFKPRHGTGGMAVNHPPNIRKKGLIFESLRYIEGDLLIIVESPLDVLRLHAMGYVNVVALYGAHMDSEQAERIMEKFSKVILFFDDDEAGRKGVSKALTLLKGMTVHVFAYTEPLRLGTYYVHAKVSDRDPGDLDKSEVDEGIRRATPGFRTGFM